MKQLYYNLQKGIFVIAFLTLYSTFAKAQTLTLRTVNAGPYTTGSTIAVPFEINTTTNCIDKNNVFTLYISAAPDAAPTRELASYSGFYAAFLNATIPTDLTPGRYYLEIRSSLPATTSDRMSINVIAGTPITASIRGEAINNSNPEIFGNCAGNGSAFGFSKTAGDAAAVQANFFNEFSQADAGTFNINPSISFNEPNKANYTVVVTATNNGTVGTKAYSLINNKVNTTFGTTGGNTVCLNGGQGALVYTVDYTSANGIQYNYPGNLYSINWGDGSSDSYTFCEIKNMRGQIPHTYNRSSCGSSSDGSNSFAVRIQSNSPVCGPVGATLTSSAVVVNVPTNSFDGPNSACVGKTVTFNNTSNPGQDPSNSGANCTNTNAKYKWYIDDQLVDFDVPLSGTFSYTFSDHGRHKITLELQQNGSICAADKIDKYICIVNTPTPQFSLPVTTICSNGSIFPNNYSYVDDICDVNTELKNRYRWNVTGPGDVVYVSGSDTDQHPEIKFTAPGIYQISLTITTENCGEFTSAAQNVVVNATPTVTLSPNVPICGNNQTLTFDNTNNSPTKTTFSGTTAEQANTYTWTVSSSNGGTFDFQGGTNANSKYPQIKFYNYDIYTVTATHTNNCGTESKSQQLDFRESPTIYAGPDQSICPDGVVQLAGTISDLAQTNYRWLGGNGTFSTNRSDKNAKYTPTETEINAGRVTLTLELLTNNPAPCDRITDDILINIYPRNAINNGNPTVNVCTNNYFTYNPTAQITGSTFRYTSTTSSGSIHGNTANGTGNINDQLFNDDPLNNGTVTYVITPVSNNNCSGTPYTITVTVTPRPIITVDASTITICSGKGTGINFSANLSGTTFKWTSAASAGISGNTSNSAAINVNTINDVLNNSSNVASGTVTYTITPVGPTGCEGTPATVTVTVQPLPLPANAGSDQTICSAATAILSGSSPGISTGTWTLVSNQSGVTFTNPNQSNSNNTTVNGLQPGETYTFRWTITGAAQCASNSDDIVINNLQDLTNTITSNSPVCYGQAVIVSGSVPTGGTGTYVYTWEYSTDNVNWTIASGQSDRDYSFTGTQNIYVRRTVTSGPCSNVSASILITVQPPLANNTIAANQVICYNTAPLELTGSTPTGADNNYTYQWQSSTDNGTNWFGINGSNTINYQPAVLTATTKFRRVVTSALCNGTQQSISNEITITVQPQNTNTLTSASTRIICTGTTFNYQPTAQQAGTTFTWVSSASATVSGNSLSGNGNISDVLVNSDPANNVIVTYTITPVNNNCPGVPFTLTVTVTPIPRVIITNSGNQICSGSPTGITFTTNNPGNVLLKWTSDNLPDIYGNNDQYPVIATRIDDILFSGRTTPATIVYHITPVSPGGCEGQTVDATVTILPQPVQADAGTDDQICNASMYTLNGNNPLPSTGKWTVTSGQNSVVFADDTRNNTTVSGLQPGETYTFRWTITGTGACSTSVDDVIIADLAPLTNNISFGSPAVCYGQAVTVNGDQPTGGNGSFVYTWESSTDNINWATVAGQSGVYYSFTATQNIYLRRIVTSGPCTNVSEPVYIIVQPPIDNNTIAADQQICYNITPNLITGSTPTGADGTFFYQWQSSTNNGASWNTINGATDISYQPASLLTTTQFRRVVSSALCNGNLQNTSNAVTITVAAQNNNALTSASSRSICTGTTFSYHPTARIANTVFTWVSSASANVSGNTASGTGDINDFLTNSDATNNGTVTYTITPYNYGCPGVPFTLTVTVTPRPVITANPASNNICSGQPAGISFTSNLTGTLYRWTSAASAGVYGNGNQPAGNASFIADMLTNNTLAAGTVTYQITPISNSGCEGTPVTVIVTVQPQVTQANAGQDEQLCAASTFALKGNNPAPFTGLWTVTSGQTGLIFADATQYNTSVNGLQPGQNYTFRWTISGSNLCPPTYDEVAVTNYRDLTNNISLNNATICYGQAVTILGDQPTGGNNNYTTRWESSTDNISWATVNNQTGRDLSVTLTSSTYFRRVITSGPCVKISQSIYVTVQPPITNNTVASNQQICYNNVPALLTGSTPAGADNTYSYQWQIITDNGASWTNITGATSINYQPGNLTATTQYRRIVTSALCTGPQQSISNPVEIIVNPLAVASFTFTNDVGCIPFAITAQNIKATASAGNNTYAWYADDVFIGSGISFPGYTIAEDDKKVVIKLIVTSKFGCPDASFSHTFTTIKEVSASFTQDQTKGCGPLTVKFTNTSSPINQATYSWNFGNGTTSTLTNPAAITFLPRSDGKDTTYTVTLRASTTCGIRTATSTVTVRPKPTSIFTPDKTTGCSPLTVTFNNTSPGTNNTYTYDFGDGETLVTNNTEAVSHTYTAVSNKVFTVKMTAQNECGSSTTQYNVRISPSTVLPQLVVNGDQKAGCAPWTVQFYNNTKGGTYFTYDFGDGTTLATLDAPEVVSHTFLKDGIYNVKLTATNGCSDTSVYQPITVYAQPKTNFTSDVQVGCKQLPVNFTSQTPGNNTYLWDFGDGGASTLANPTHIYTARSTPYTVSLIAKNTLGCTDTMVMKNYITVTLPPKAAFIAKPDSVIAYPRYDFSFADKSTNNPIIWKWNFGDGTSASKQNPEHTYRDTGTYVVKLIVYNLQGCADTITHKVQITGVPGQLFVPNAFMPTSRFNEVITFKPKGSGLKNWRMRVFNKWGQVIWETTKLTDRGEPAEGWDGMMNGAPAPQGVYVWQIDATYVNGAEWEGMRYNGSAPSRTGIIHLIQ